MNNVTCTQKLNHNCILVIYRLQFGRQTQIRENTKRIPVEDGDRSAEMFNRRPGGESARQHIHMVPTFCDDKKAFGRQLPAYVVSAITGK